MVKKYVLFIAAVILSAALSRCSQDEESVTAFLAGVRDLVRPAAKVYLAIFGQPETALILSFLMACACIGLLVYYWVAEIRRATQAIRAVTDDLLSFSAVPPGDEKAATARLMAGVPLLEDEWKLFESTLVESERDGIVRFYTTFRPREYFTMGAMESRGLSFRFLHALPGYFVGFGLMFTFLGLVAGLYFASKGLQTADFAAARLALGKLLNASTLKFVSSVVGIGASLATSIAVSSWYKTVQGALDDLCRAIEMRFPAMSRSLLVAQVRPDAL
jgi:hypothetical protein